MFLLKKFIATMVMPLPLTLALIGAGAALLLFTKRSGAGKTLVAAGWLILLVLSYNRAGDALVGSLERAYPPVAPGETAGVAHDLLGVRRIVVLGGGNTNDPGLPSTSEVSGPSLVRLCEGIRLHRMIPGSILVLSGGSGFDTSTDASAMRRVAIGLGVPAQEIETEGDSKDTDDQARILAPRLRGERFLLVTSASHMPRAMALFTKLGARPVAAPTDYLIRPSEPFRPSRLFPTVEGLRKSEIVVYESLGRLWSFLRGKS